MFHANRNKVMIVVLIHFFSYKFASWTSSYTSMLSVGYVVDNITFLQALLRKTYKSFSTSN